MNYSVMTERETEIELNTSVSEGLTSFTAHDRLLEKGRNLPEKAYSKSVFTLVASQFRSLYTVAFFAMGIITALVDFKKSMGAWIIFFAVAVINMVSGFLRDNKGRRAANAFDESRSGEVKVLRDGKIFPIDPTLLVKGDIVLLEEGDFVGADLRIMECDSLKADESVFGHGSVPKNKQSERMEEDEGFLKSKNILYTGSVIVQGSGKGAVIATGKDTALGRIQSSKSKKLHMHEKFAKNAVSEKILVLAAILCATVVMVYMSLTTHNVKLALLTACGISFCLLPAPIAMVRWLTGKVFEKKFQSDGVLIENEDTVKKMSEADYLLFDKGGMLTQGDMEVEETLISDSDKIKMAVICSDCNVVNGKIEGSSIDLATAAEATARGIDAVDLLNNTERILYMPFDETRKLMATLVKHNEGYRLIIKGSIEVIPTLCISLSDGDSEVEMTGEVMHRLENISSSMAERGLKIRAVAYRDIDFVPENIEDEIKSMVFVGAFGYREIMVKKAKDAIKKIESVFVRPVMVTGDDVITAAAVAKMAGLIKKESECISFRELIGASDKELCEAAEKYKVFATASREDRERLVKVLSEKGHTLVVTGEQMAESEVALSAACSIVGETRSIGDVKVREENITTVADVICGAREMRGNMAYASLLGISLGMAEVLFLLWMMFSVKGFHVEAFNILLLNIFVVSVPCIILSVFARVKQRLHNQKMLMARCALEAVLCALFAILARDNFMMYFVFYSLFESGRVCASFKNLEKGRPGGKGLIAVLVVTFLAIVIANVSSWDIFTGENLGMTFLFAAIPVAVNGVLSRIGWKGFGAEDV